MTSRSAILRNRQSLERAFQLAHFLHGDRSVALRVATEAMARLEVASQAQRKRLYYRPSGRTTGRQRRNKVLLDDGALLQRLVFIQSEPYERASETEPKPEALSEDDMMVRFVKHLVRVTVKRNSFYVAVGMGRVLHDYSTAAVLDLHSLVLSDPADVRDEDYCRSRKRQLMNELKRRFGSLLSTERGPRGEQRFRTRRGPAVEALIRRCLEMFTPWDSRCPLPPDVQPGRDPVPDLQSQGDDPDQEHPVELRRMHALLHPDCFSRLAEGLELDPPAARLTAPCFSLASDGPSSGAGVEDKTASSRHDGCIRHERLDRPAPGLTDQELGTAIGELQGQAQARGRMLQRRRRDDDGAGPQPVLILVDGERRGSFDPWQDEAIALDLEPGAELIELVASEGSAHAEGSGPLLGVHLVQPALGEATETAVLELGAKRQVAIEINGDPERHRELTLQGQAKGLLPRLSAWLTPLADRRATGASPAIAKTRWAAAAVATTILAVAGGLLLQTSNELPSPQVPAPEFANTRARTELPPGPTGPEAQNNLYVPSLGQDAWGQELAGCLQEALDLRGLVSVQAPGDAALALKRLSPAQEAPLLSLVSPEGAVLWSVPEAQIEPCAAARQAAGEADRLLR